MNEKKQASRAAAKPAPARKVAGKPTPRRRAKPADAADRLLEELRETYRKATEEAAKRPPSGFDPQALLEHIGTMSEEHAAVFEEALRWIRSEDDEAA